MHPTQEEILELGDLIVQNLVVGWAYPLKNIALFKVWPQWNRGDTRVSGVLWRRGVIVLLV